MIERLLIINNLPTPYRVVMFDAIDEALRLRGGMVEVAYMAASEPGRHWFGCEQQHQVTYKLWPGYRVNRGGITFHLNPGLVHHASSSRFDAVLLGGGWHQPTNQGVLHRRTKGRVLWSEANPFARLTRSQTVARLRSRIVARADSLAVPNGLARSTITSDWGIVGAHFVRLPNVADAARFSWSESAADAIRAEVRQRYGIPSGHRLLLWPARLVDARKGFTLTLQDLDTRDLHLMIAGAGPDRQEIEAAARRRGLDVTFTGQVEAENLSQLMAASDAVILGSLIDPNPLVLIEALWAGKPLLVSRYCGNVNEVVSNDNGMVFDPRDPLSIRCLARQLATMTDDQLRLMGKRSLEVANALFDPMAVANHFLDDLADLPVTRQRRLG